MPITPAAPADAVATGELAGPARSGRRRLVRPLPAREATFGPLIRLWREEVGHRRGGLSLVLLLTVAMAGLTALYPLVISRALDMFTEHDPRILYQVPLLVVAITAAKAAAQYGQTVGVQHLVLMVIRGLQERMFAHLVRADVARIEREPPATLSARFTTDATVIREALIRATNSLGDAVTVVGLIGSMLWMDWELSLIAALLYPLAAVPIGRIGRRVRRASGGMQERIGETAALLNESFAQARTVRAYRLEEAEIARAGAAFAALTQALLRMTRGRARVEPVLEVLGGTAVAAVLGFAGWRASVGGATLGDFSGFVAALLLAARPLRALGTLNASLQEGLAGLTRVYGVIDEHPGVQDRAGAPGLPPGRGHLVFDRVAFRYPDGRCGLAELSFEARPGQTVALVGASGAGKSTALSLIPRLHDVTGGRILLDGADLRDLSLASLRDHIAYVGQETMLFDCSVEANIRMGRPDATAAAVEAAARDAAALDFVRALPDGFATVVGTGGQLLSGGQRQRVALARAIARDPRVLLLDEATSALDAENEAAVQGALARLRRGRTTIVVAHRLATVRSADLVVVLSEGRAAEAGTHAELMRHDGLYARLVRTQALAA